MRLFVVYMRLICLGIFCVGVMARVCAALPRTWSGAMPALLRPQAGLSGSVALIENSACDIDVRLPSMPTRFEAEAANFLAKCLSKTCKSGRISVSYFGSWRKGAKTPIYMSVSEDGCFSDGWNGDGVFVKYSSPSLSMFAVAEFLSKYFKADFFAPPPLGFNILQISNLRIAKKARKYKPSFKSVALSMPGNRNAEWCRISGADALGRMAKFSHNLGRIFSPEAFKKYPDLFSRRLTLYGGYVPGMAGQPDVLNVEAQNFAAKAAENFFKNNPLSPMFALGIKDTPHMDQRPEYKNFQRGYFWGLPDWSNAIFKFSNAVAERAVANSGKYIGVLAYSIATNTPSFKVNPAIVPYVCSDRSNSFDKEYAKADGELLKRWASSGAQQWGIYDYFYGSPYFIPRETENFIWDSLRRAHFLGARLYYAESYAVWAYDAHKLWILTRLLRDINADAEKLRNEFFRKYYGPAAGHVSKFFDIAAKAWANRKYPPLWLSFYKSEASAELLSEEDLAQMRSCVERAALAAGDTVKSARVRELKLVFDITESAWKAYKAKIALFRLCNSNAGSADIAAALNCLHFLEAKKLRAIGRQASMSRYPKADFSWLANDISSPFDLALKNISTRGDFISASDFPMLAELEFERKIDKLPAYYSAKFGFECGNSMDFLSNDRVPGLSVYNEDFENQRLGIYPEAAESGSYGLLFENCSNSGVGASLRVSPGDACRFGGRFKSELMPGSMCYATIAFYSGDGLCMGRKTLLLPWSSDGKFWDFYLSAVVPPKAVRADYSIFASRMKKGERLLVDNVYFESKKTGNAGVRKKHGGAAHSLRR